MPTYYAMVFIYNNDTANQFISPRPPHIGTDRAAVEDAIGMTRIRLLCTGVQPTGEVIEIEDTDNFPTAQAEGYPYPISTLEPMLIRGPLFDSVFPDITATD